MEHKFEGFWSLLQIPIFVIPFGIMTGKCRIAYGEVGFLQVAVYGFFHIEDYADYIG